MGSADRDIAAEHRELCAAAVDCDAERAVRLLAEHIERTTEVLLRKQMHGQG